MNLTNRYVLFPIFLAIFVLSLWGVLYGTQTIYLICAFIIAFVLFCVRKNNLIVYGVTEIIAGIFVLYQSGQTGKGDFSPDFSSDFKVFRWQLVIVATLSGIYIIVRGLDNIDRGREQSRK